ncbi:MAG: tRNA dimethylallyltransferase, partial [Calditrichia bacterium]
AAGIPLSELQKQKADPPDFIPVKFGITKKREQLYADIESRVDAMFAEGLTDEVAELLKRGFAPELNSLNTVGYKEVIEHLQGRISLEECLEKIKQNTRRYAKRQMTWFRREKDVLWLEVAEGGDYERIAELIRHKLQEAVV